MSAALIKVDFNNDIPIYIQLRNQIIQGIASGELKVGEGLPTVRQLASDLGINLHTVNKAYNLLKQDGFLCVNRKSGVVVSLSQELQSDDRYENSLREELMPIIAEACCRKMSQDKLDLIIKELYNRFNFGG